ncbi:hypothetical protein PR048_009057 [Dryococelus australis]|uniref:Uncharacterized protein n=1 Tax=Dryococelus australis TaxID=614101 RepID=A0ABQ9HYU7_9NEOP|nr:hypothetical protein PR048_009057 [Dryococelus australis]
MVASNVEELEGGQHPRDSRPTGGTSSNAAEVSRALPCCDLLAAARAATVIALHKGQHSVALLANTAPRVTLLGIEPSSRKWEASSLTTTPPRPRECKQTPEEAVLSGEACPVGDIGSKASWFQSWQHYMAFHFTVYHHNIVQARAESSTRWGENGVAPDCNSGEDPRENPPSSGIVRHDSQLRRSGSTRPGIEPVSHWWNASICTLWLRFAQCGGIERKMRNSCQKIEKTFPATILVSPTYVYTGHLSTSRGCRPFWRPAPRWRRRWCIKASRTIGSRVTQQPPKDCVWLCA